MDKYTVDLDKVLNDFEFSEYSLESAKLNRNIQEEIPNSSFTSNFSNKNDTTVKHSINNVFHSLNEYLSSDITPKKIENVQKTPTIADIMRDPHTSFLPQITNLPEANHHEISQDTSKQHLTDFKPEINCQKPAAKELIEKEVLDKTDNFNNVDNLHPEEESKEQKIEEGSSQVGDLVCINDDVEVKDTQNEPSEEILVDLQTNIVLCDTNNEELIKIQEIIDEEETKLTSLGFPIEIQLPNRETSELNVDNQESGATVKNESGVVKIGFEKDIDIDEAELDHYFQELEQEFGEQVEDLESSEGKIDESEIVNGDQTIHCEVKEETVRNGEEKESMIKEDLEISKKNINYKEKKSDLQITITAVSAAKMEENTQVEEATGSCGSTIHSLESSLQKINENSREDVNIENSKTENIEVQSDNEKLEVEKNSRPQHLILNAENPDARKINLIGDPGSTPFNNVYSTEDFEKIKPEQVTEKATGGLEGPRPPSPTYSDVSTDSVSSSTSDDDAKYSDAKSELQAEKKATQVEIDNKEIVQNNMISAGEICRSDVTTDKDFKNNLKTTNLDDTAEGSKSNLETQIQDKEERTEGETSGGGDVGASEIEAEGAGVLSQTLEGPTSDQTRVDEPSSTLGVDWLGKQAPLWIPDNETLNCLHCDMKFNVIKRRHHCRACGLVLCSKCCNLKYRLEYLDSDARVCKKCYDILNKDTNSSSGSEISQESASPVRNSNTGQGLVSGQPNPNNPLEYCSTVPPMQQVDPGAMATPSVMVPVGVLKRKGSNKGRSNKSVMFCDGIRPGSDLTNLDTDFNYLDSQKVEKLGKSPEKSGKTGKNLELLDGETRSFIPSDEDNLPPTVTIFKTDIKYSPCANNASVVEMLKNESLTFALHSNVFVHVKIINMDCCVNRKAWCFSTEGLINVGQDEIVILLEYVENELLVPKDIFIHLNNIYLQAVKGSSVKELGLSLHTSSPFLGSKNHAGFVYIRPTFQCVQNVLLPKEPYLVGILIHRWETPWAKLFPLRLVLRLGAEYKYYPSPIISTRDRDSVFVEVGHTIINLLADFRNYSYTLPLIRGLTIHMEDKNTTVTIPVNRYDQVLKGLCNSSDHILAFAGNFSTNADSHLVCIQDTHSATNNYSTHAINICNQPRKVTGASFIVFNGALKSTSGLTAKSNIVEDGLMIQILPEHMLQVRESLKNMKNHTIRCGCVNEESDETVTIVWGEPDSCFNVGIASPIDNKAMTGVPSIRVHNGKDYTCNSGSRLIRWTEVFIIQSGDETSKTQEPLDISKISENIAKATCQALVKYLDLLVSNSFYKIALRANLHMENVSYSAGSNNVKLPPIYMKSLDNELIPVLHRITSNNLTEQPIVVELVFRILNI